MTSSTQKPFGAAATEITAQELVAFKLAIGHLDAAVEASPALAGSIFKLMIHLTMTHNLFVRAIRQPGDDNPFDQLFRKVSKGYHMPQNSDPATDSDVSNDELTAFSKGLSELHNAVVALPTITAHMRNLLNNLVVDNFDLVHATLQTGEDNLYGTLREILEAQVPPAPVAATPAAAACPFQQRHD